MDNYLLQNQVLLVMAIIRLCQIAHKTTPFWSVSEIRLHTD